jgi:hypothetical protein
MDSARPLRLDSFEEFWPFYVSQHRKEGTRALHFAGTTLGLLCLVRAIAARLPWFVLWGLVLSYGLAWIGHFFIEKNRPATFQYPFWSFAGDMKMYGLMWQGKMTVEAERLGYGDPGETRAVADRPASPLP